MRIDGSAASTAPRPRVQLCAGGGSNRHRPLHLIAFRFDQLVAQRRYRVWRRRDERRAVRRNGDFRPFRTVIGPPPITGCP